MENNQNAKVQENRREDKRAFKKFIVALVLAAIAGGFIGAGSMWLARVSDGMAEAVLIFMSVAAPFGNLLLAVLLLLWYAVVLRRLRKRFLLWDGEDEELINGIEHKLSLGMIATGVGTVLSFFFLAAGVYVLDLPGVDMYDIMTPVRLGALLGGLVCVTAVNTFLQKELVNFTKEINPEKQGSVYDIKFQKTWMKSCDEAEQAQIYKAGYFAFQMGSVSCLILFVFCFTGMVAWDYGLVPVTMVLLIWLIQIVSYGVKCLGKNTRRQDA